MSRRFPCCIPGCLVCRPRGAIDRLREDRDRDRAERAFWVRRMLAEVKRARREDDPTVN